MPFTFSHPAIVLPLTLFPRQWFSLTGLVIGSLTPDFEYFLRMKVRSDYSHTIGGLFWFDLPLGILLAFLFHNIARDSLFNNLPPVLKTRLFKYKQFNWPDYFSKNWLVVTYSLVLGAASHLLWDSFTHQHGYFVGALPTLAENVKILSAEIPVFKILQHSSTLMGGAAIAVAFYHLPVDKEANHSSNNKYWVALVVLTQVVIGLRLISGLQINMYGHLVATAIAGIMLSLILTPFIIRLAR